MAPPTQLVNSVPIMVTAANSSSFLFIQEHPFRNGVVWRRSALATSPAQAPQLRRRITPGQPRMGRTVILLDVNRGEKRPAGPASDPGHGSVPW